MNSKQVIDLNVKHKTINLLNENTGEKSSWPRVRRRALKYDIKSMIHKRK